LQRRIERTLFYLEQIVGTLLDVLNQRISVSWPTAKRLEDHHFESAGEKIATSGFCHRPFYYRHRVKWYWPVCQEKSKVIPRLTMAGQRPVTFKPCAILAIKETDQTRTARQTSPKRVFLS